MSTLPHPRNKLTNSSDSEWEARFSSSHEEGRELSPRDRGASRLSPPFKGVGGGCGRHSRHNCQKSHLIAGVCSLALSLAVVNLAGVRSAIAQETTTKAVSHGDQNANGRHGGRSLQEVQNTTESGRTTTQPARSAAAIENPVATTRAQPSARKPYTAPRVQFRTASNIAMMAGAISMAGVSTGGREVSESALANAGASFGGVSGSAGLGAPQTFTANALPSQPGIQRGLAIGFGPVARNNLFTRSINPISGPGGGCGRLLRAGLIRSPGECRNLFRR